MSILFIYSSDSSNDSQITSHIETSIIDIDVLEDDVVSKLSRNQKGNVL